MKLNLQHKLSRRERLLMRRIDKANWSGQSPMIAPPSIQYELAGGTCIEHLELRRNDEPYLNALGAERIPDPTTAGDCCRRFSKWDVFAMIGSYHDARLKVRKQWVKGVRHQLCAAPVGPFRQLVPDSL